MKNITRFFRKLAIFSLILLDVSLAHSVEIKKFTQQEWEQLSEKVDSWVDYRGFSVDSKIRELVIALNAVGIVTSASCEGHLKRELPYPWIDIDIETDESRQLREQEDLLWKEMKKEEKLLQEKFPELSSFELRYLPGAQLFQRLHDEWSNLYDKTKQIDLINLENLYFLLERFYETHRTSYDCLIFPSREDFGPVRIRNMGGNLQQIRSEKEKKMKLREYQKEMENLANFIKTNFQN